MKIAVVVHGRFHTFELVRALMEFGEDVTLFTNYPKRKVEKWGIPRCNVESILIHGILARIVHEVRALSVQRYFEPRLHSLFSKLVRRKIRGEKYDVVMVFSGVAEEIFEELKGKGTLKILVRGSSHIDTQNALLSEESARSGRAVERPGQWIIAREKREYELADSIQVLSSFALNSFLDKGIQREKVHKLILGVDTGRFRPDEKIISGRQERILSGKPLRILTVGSFSFRKGILDLEKIISVLFKNFHFTFVGDVPDEGRDLAERLDGKCRMIPRQPEVDLTGIYDSSDIFIFPTIEDGFAVVLNQALSAGLPVVCTSNCCGPDVVNEGKTGWVLPIRSPELFIDRLKWCDSNREELAEMARNVYGRYSRDRTWNDTATDLIRICKNRL